MSLTITIMDSQFKINVGNRVVAEMYIDYEGELNGMNYVDAIQEPELYSSTCELIDRMRKSSKKSTSHG
jgi:hypothetical protein